MRLGRFRLRIALAALLLPAFTAVTAIGLLLSCGDSMAADASRGQLLYENHCTVCHTSVVHVREQHKARSREDIQAWIRRWQKELALNWGSGEIDDVAEFLNQRYYRLEKDS
jgi:mono/diheme cytochrome c family protein